MTAAVIACASPPAPLETVTEASVAVREAQQRGVRSDARLDLHQAEEHLELAKTALQEERYDDARGLAQKAQAEAELATAKGETAMSERNLTSIRADLKAFQTEIERASRQGSALGESRWCIRGTSIDSL